MKKYLAAPKAFPLPTILSIVHSKRLTKAGTKGHFDLLKHVLGTDIRENEYFLACRITREILLDEHPGLKETIPPETISNCTTSPITEWMNAQKSILGETLLIPKGKGNHKLMSRRARHRPKKSAARITAALG